MDDQKKTKILWMRELLHKNAPMVYDYYKSYKLNKTHEHRTSNDRK